MIQTQHRSEGLKPQKIFELLIPYQHTKEERKLQIKAVNKLSLRWAERRI